MEHNYPVYKLVLPNSEILPKSTRSKKSVTTVVKPDKHYFSLGDKEPTSTVINHVGSIYL